MKVAAFLLLSALACSCQAENLTLILLVAAAQEVRNIANCLSSLTESAAACALQRIQIGQSVDVVLTSMARAESTAYYKAKPCHAGCGYNYMHEFLASIFIIIYHT